MFWVHPKYGSQLAAASVDTYDALAQLTPTDHFVEKQGRSTARYQIITEREIISLYVKKYFRMPWWRRWLGPIDNFPGPRELANLRQAAALGIAVGEPVVAGANRRHPCKSLLAVRELEGYVPLHEFIPARFTDSNTNQQRALRRELTERLADVARRLHAANLYHCDFYLCHFLIRETPGASEMFDLILIDLTRLKHSLRPRWQVKDLGELLFSTDLPGISRTDRLRFFKRYLGVERLNAPNRRLLRRIQRKADKYHRHNSTITKKSASLSPTMR